MNPCHIIAEAGVNHNGSIDLAFRLIDAAVEAGADGVKFQTFRPENLVTAGASKAEYQIANTGDGTQSQLQMLRQLALPLDQYVRLKEHCDQAGIEFLSTPFDEESVDCLEPLVHRYKIPSGEVTNLPFLEYVSAKRKPILLSTGMSTLAEVAQAVDTLRNSWPQIERDSLWLLHCSTNYPCPHSDVNLRAMQTLRSAFAVPVGYSDHTRGIEVSVAAVAMGAIIIEKHFTLDRSLPGPDHKASLDPREFRELVTAIRHVHESLGDGIKRPAASEIPIRELVRKSLVAAVEIPSGTIVTRTMVTVKRPGNGISPGQIHQVIGLKAHRSIHRDHVLFWDDFQVRHG